MCAIATDRPHGAWRHPSRTDSKSRGIAKRDTNHHASRLWKIDSVVRFAGSDRQTRRNRCSLQGNAPRKRAMSSRPPICFVLVGAAAVQPPCHSASSSVRSNMGAHSIHLDKSPSVSNCFGRPIAPDKCVCRSVVRYTRRSRGELRHLANTRNAWRKASGILTGGLSRHGSVCQGSDWFDADVHRRQTRWRHTAGGRSDDGRCGAPRR